MDDRAEALQDALKSTLGYETVSSHMSEDGAQVTFYGRVAGSVPNFLEAVKRLLLASKDQTWDLDPSKVWLLRGSRLVHAYRLIFQGEDVLAQVPVFIQTLAVEPKVCGELKSIELPGGGRYRNAYKGGKGADLTGRAAVGAAALNMGRS